MAKLFLQYLSKIKHKSHNQKGFTLIELLVVVIIIGVLAAVALPNLLGQVGKARESELKNAVGTINRSQQAYHFERQTFSDTIDKLGIEIPQKYQTAPPTITGTDSEATVVTTNANAIDDGTRAYSGLVTFADGSYESAVCQSNEIVDTISAPTDPDTCADGVILR